MNTIKSFMYFSADNSNDTSLMTGKFSCGVHLLKVSLLQMIWMSPNTKVKNQLQCACSLTICNQGNSHKDYRLSVSLCTCVCLLYLLLQC